MTERSGREAGAAEEHAYSVLDGSCIEVKLVPGTYYSMLGAVQRWKDVAAEAMGVERVHALRGWAEWTAVYRVVVAGGRWRYYFVAEEPRIAVVDLTGSALVRVESSQARACVCPCSDAGHGGLCEPISEGAPYYLALVGSARSGRSAPLCEACVRALWEDGHIDEVMNRPDVFEPLPVVGVV